MDDSNKPPARPLPMRPTGSGESAEVRLVAETVEGWRMPIGPDVDLQVGSEEPAVLPRNGEHPGPDMRVRDSCRSRTAVMTPRSRCRAFCRSTVR